MSLLIQRSVACIAMCGVWLLSWLVVLVLVFAIAALVGCEVRRAEVVRGDGSWAKYTRTTFFGDSTTEGVSVIKEGNDFSFGVGATGSDADTEAFRGLLIDLAKRGAGLPIGQNP